MRATQAKAQRGRHRVTVILLTLAAAGIYAATLLHFGHLS